MTMPYHVLALSGWEYLKKRQCGVSAKLTRKASLSGEPLQAHPHDCLLQPISFMCTPFS